jgi:hypothetical protein
VYTYPPQQLSVDEIMMATAPAFFKRVASCAEKVVRLVLASAGPDAEESVGNRASRTLHLDGKLPCAVTAPTWLPTRFP